MSDQTSPIGAAPARADRLIHPQWIVPVVPHGAVLRDYSIATEGDRISALLPRSDARNIDADEELELPGQVVLPGLVNSHGHAALCLLRGFADDTPLMTWLEEHIWPAEFAHMSEDYVRDGTELAIAEMIRSGTTTYSDMHLFPNVSAATARRLRMRCQITFPVIDFASDWGRDAADYISKGLALRDEYKHVDLVNVVFGPHAPYTVSEENLARVATLAAELDIGVQIHLHETSGEVEQSLEEHGERPLHKLNRLGLLGPRTQCVHMTALDAGDIALVAQTGASVVHCPQSNMKLASGTCPVGALRAGGVNVALGTDSAASNNNLNLFQEMQAAALLAKLDSGDAAALPAADALAMATIAGARAMGLEHSIGSLEPGKQADMIAVDLGQPETQPLYNVLSQLVYACNGSQVRHSWIAGEPVLVDRELVLIDLPGLAARVDAWRERIAAGMESAA